MPHSRSVTAKFELSDQSIRQIANSVMERVEIDLEQIRRDAKAEERDRITDQLDDWGDEIQDFYPGANFELRQTAKAVLHDAAKRIHIAGETQ